MEGAALSAPAIRATQAGNNTGVLAGLKMGRYNDTGADRAAPSIEETQPQQTSHRLPGKAEIRAD